MDKVADEIAAAIEVPFVHIADTHRRRCPRRGLRQTGLLATRYTMEQDFYVGRFRRCASALEWSQ
jgi:aspartate racemase